MLNLLFKKISTYHSAYYFIFIFFVSVIVYSGAIFKTKSIIWGDSLYYYAYTKSIVIDHDIDFSNEAYRKDYGFPNEPKISNITNKVVNKFSPGSSILWIPTFLIGYLITGDGYSFLTQYIVAISTIIFSVIGLFFIFKTINVFFNKKISLLTTAFMYLSTQMLYYTSVDPLNSHSASFLVSSLFLYLLISFSNKFTWQRMTILGFLGGLLVLIRNQDLVIFLPISIYLFIINKDNFLEFANRMILFWGGIFLIFSIQIFTTINLYGLIGSPYLISGEKLNWLNPNFFRVLFSFGNGLFTFAPILFFAVVGLFLVQKKSIEKYLSIKKLDLFKIMTFFSLLIFFFQLYIVASWGKEIIGGPYGSRMFISILPYLSLGLAVILEKFSKQNHHLLKITIILSLLLINNLVQTAIMLFRF